LLDLFILHLIDFKTPCRVDIFTAHNSLSTLHLPFPLSVRWTAAAAALW